jgi:hypothetical protein
LTPFAAFVSDRCGDADVEGSSSLAQRADPAGHGDRRAGLEEQVLGGDPLVGAVLGVEVGLGLGVAYGD